MEALDIGDLPAAVEVLNGGEEGVGDEVWGGMRVETTEPRPEAMRPDVGLGVRPLAVPEGPAIEARLSNGANSE